MYKYIKDLVSCKKILSDLSGKQIQRKSSILINSLVLLIAGTGLAEAASYPDRPITMIVPFAAGGPADVVARSLSDALRKPLGVTIVVENVAGAGGTIGYSKAAKSKNDGYTILLNHIGIVATPALYKNLSYDIQKDFESVGMVVSSPMVLLARRDFPANNFDALIKNIKSSNGSINMGNAGTGSASHLCGLVLQKYINSSINLIPYRGQGPAMTDLMAGRVDLMCGTGITLNEYVKAYATTSKKRTTVTPDVPTVTELGVPELELDIWHGLSVPKGTPKDAVQRLSQALQIATNDPSFKKQMDAQGITVLSNESNPKSLDSRINTDMPRIASMLKSAGVKPQ